jgi:hypothetical protein
MAGGTTSWNQGKKAVSPTARHSAKIATTTPMYAKSASGLQWLAAQGTSSSAAVAVLRAAQHHA